MYAARRMCQIIYESLHDEFLTDLRQSDEPVTLIGTIQILCNHWTGWVGPNNRHFCLLSVQRGWVGQRKSKIMLT